MKKTLSTTTTTTTSTSTMTTSTTNITTTTATTTTTTTLANRNLGIVSKCTLVGAQNINVYGDKYCVVNIGEKSQSEAYSQCRALNARLPLPKSVAEMATFLKISPNSTWIGIRNSVQGRNL